MNVSVTRLFDQIAHAEAAGYLALFERAATRYGLPLETLLGVASRESCLGTCLDSRFTGDHGHGRGLMQIDDRWHPDFVAAHDNRDHAANIDYGARILREELDRFGGQEVPALAAYNAGARRVRSALDAGRHPDAVTTGGDYSTDVRARSAHAGAWLFQNRAGGPVAAGPLDDFQALLGGFLGRLGTGSTFNLILMPDQHGVCVGLRCPDRVPGTYGGSIPDRSGTTAPVGMPAPSGTYFVNPENLPWLFPSSGAPYWFGAPQEARVPTWAVVALGGAAAGMLLRQVLR